MLECDATLDLETLEEPTILSSITCRTSKRCSARGLQKLWLAKLESIWLCRKRGLIRSIPTDFRINSGNSWGVPTWPFVKVKESKRKHKKMKEHESYESWRHLYYISRFYVVYQASVVAVMARECRHVASSGLAMKSLGKEDSDGTVASPVARSAALSAKPIFPGIRLVLWTSEFFVLCRQTLEKTGINSVRRTFRLLGMDLKVWVSLCFA